MLKKNILYKGLSKQSFSICKNIREIDKFLDSAPEFKNKIVEGHPEICFAMLNSNDGSAEPILENKKTVEGMQKRLEVLSKYYDKVQAVEALLHSDHVLRKVKDDVIDALCLAVTGMIGYKNGFKTIPENPMKDSRGILMQMIYAV